MASFSSSGHSGSSSGTGGSYRRGAADPEISLIRGSPDADSSPVSRVWSILAADEARYEGNQSESVGREDSEGVLSLLFLK